MRYLFIISALFSFQSGIAQNYTVYSPAGKIAVSISNNQVLSYQINYKGKVVIKPSQLGFKLNKPNVILSRFDVVTVDSLVYNEAWTPVWGEVNKINNHYKELAITLVDKSPHAITLKVVFRVYDEGVGFRYEFPGQVNKYLIVGDELTQFSLAGDHKTFWIPGDYDTNEYLYNTTRLSEIDAVTAANKEPDIAVKSVIGSDAIQTPVLLKTADGLYISLHEAALSNYPAMHLNLDKPTLTFQAHLVPDAVGNKAYLENPARTPWRTIIISDKATELLASKMILNLNEPTRFATTEWIKPQKFVGMWWEMHIGKATWELASGKHGANTANVKRYIDFASKHGFDGVLVEGWNVGWEDWFGNWKEDVFDFITPYPDYDLKELTKYAKQKGVQIIMHHETSGSAFNYERWLDKAFQFMNDNNMNTVKTGYVGKIIPRGEHHDSQWMINHYQRVAEKAAEHKIMVASHESVRPTGLHRTYPNWMASEAARGSEFNNAPALGITPEHTTILPFTRLMGGPMDFTPGLFRFKLNQFEPTRTTEVRTTLAKQLALYVTIYSPLQMVADLPENYEKHTDALQFIVDVPVDWDDTKILEAEPGDYLTVARKAKNKNDWYLGAITDENSRVLNLNFDFLDAGKKYQASIYRDGEQAHWKTNPEAYVIEKKLVTKKTKIKINLAPGGGCAISIREVK
ncbi:MAG: glycoside hydrolase family 97 protein [Cyclobacteriaceae bacterium]|nr:glycoside hydrolase family 97 protein [Cyclobacteriaceae bacterium]